MSSSSQQIAKSPPKSDDNEAIARWRKSRDKLLPLLNRKYSKDINQKKDIWLDDDEWAEWCRVFGVGEDPVEVEMAAFPSMNLLFLPANVGKWQQAKNINISRFLHVLFAPNIQSYLPTTVGLWHSVTELDASKNQLMRLPPKVGEWASIQCVNLSFNQLTELPESAANWSRLEFIDVSGWLCSALIVRCQMSRNKLVTMPQAVCNWVALRDLRLSENQLSKVPDGLGACTNLQKVDLDSNRLTNLPSFVGNWRKLQAIGLENNSLSELPPEVGQWRQLKEINLDFNPLRHPPLSVCECGEQAIVAYMRASQHKQPRPNDVLLLVGHGGCGKTTFTRAMANDNKDFRLIVQKAKELVEEWDADQLKTWILELMMMEAGMEGLEAREIVNVEDPATVFPSNNKMTKKMIDVMKSEWWKGDGVDGEDWIDEDEEDNWKTLEKVLKKFKKTLAKVKMARDLLMSVEDEEKFNLIVKADPKLIYQPLIFLPHVRTVGIDEDQIWRGFRIWDMAGQAEYLPAHSLFMAETSAVYLVLCDVRHTDEERERQWRCWLSFIQALIPEEFREEAEKTKIPAVTVVMALTHCDEEDPRRVERAQKHGKEVFSRYEKYLGLVNDQVFALNYCDATTIDAVKSALVQQSSRVQHSLINQLMEHDNNMELALKKSSEELNAVDNSGSSTPGLFVQRALAGVDLKTIRTRFETCSTLTDATLLVNDMANKKLADYDPPVVDLAEFKQKLAEQQQRSSIPDDLDDENARLSFAESLLQSTIAALTGAGIIRVTDNNVVLQPIQWLAKRLGIIIEKHDPQNDRHGFLDIDFLDTTCNISAKHGHALLELLVAEGLACWKTENQRDSVLIPLMMKKATQQEFGALNSFIDQCPIKAGRRFKIQLSNASGRHDQLPAGFFNILQVRLMNDFQQGDLKQFAGLAAVWVPIDNVQQPPLLIVFNRGHCFDVVALGANKKTTMHSLRLGCGLAGDCWQTHSGLTLVKTALCVDCAFDDNDCGMANVELETDIRPHVEKWKHIMHFGVQLKAEHWNYRTSLKPGHLLKLLCCAEDKEFKFELEPMDYWEELMLECKEMPTTTSAWCATQNNNVDVLQALLLTPDSTPPATTTLLAHLPPRQRIEIAKTFGSVWEEIAAHFDFTKQSIESEIVGGELATTIDKSKFLVEKLSKKGVTLQDMSTAMNQCELGGELKAKLSDILPQ